MLSTWRMHRILLREVVIDAPTDTFAATRDFWAAALLAEARQIEDYPEFTALVEPASMSWVGLQDIGVGAARFHLDIETDNVAAEVARLTALGAAKVADGRTWVVMEDPNGLLFDVVPYESPWFAERSHEVS
jgi:Glyoxalase-like domain